MLYNEHVYKYYRWKGWVAQFKTKRHFRAFFMYDFARQEREAQLK